jgi:phosphoserine aminotransferase
MISFYPGPSRVYDQIPAYTKEAHRLGILSMNHRSAEFMTMNKKTISLLKSKLSIPKTYTILFTSSATECWEVIAQSLTRKHSIHIYNGAFGEKWFGYTRRLRPDATSLLFDPETQLDPIKATFSEGEIICLTQNETSNGTQLDQAIIRNIQKNNPNHLIVVDATSSMAGIRLDFKSADVWFASVQKCFGLPAGLAVMVLSPKAMKRMAEINESAHYNSLTLMARMMDRWQTSCTPNVLGIYLLMSVLENVSRITEVHEKTELRFHAWEEFFAGSGKLGLLIQNPRVRSLTVLAIKGNPEQIDKLKAHAKRKGFLLGEGYGPLKKDTFRIANFPALKETEIKSLKSFLSPMR